MVSRPLSMSQRGSECGNCTVLYAVYLYHVLLSIAAATVERIKEEEHLRPTD
jgi:hypothetical protein